MDDEQGGRLRDLMIRSQAGDTAAYKQLLEAVMAELRPYFLRRLSREDLVDDVLQDTLLALHKARHTYLPARPFAPWLYTIASHRMLDVLRKLRRTERHIPLEDIGAADEAAPAAGSTGGDRLDAEKALAQLSDKQLRVVELLKLKGLSVVETAHRLGLSVSDVKVTAHRGYEAIRRYFGLK